MTELTWPNLLTGLVGRQDLSPDASQWAMNEILSNNASPAQMAAFMVALRAKGETVEEIAGLAQVMLDRATPVDLPREAVDVVGSGGDRANTVNISTMAAIVAAGAGVGVIKHGNRAASSMCGTADCLEALGVSLTVPPARQREVFETVGLVFLFAPLYHPSLRFAGPTRKELGVQTTFNFLGPLSNPARPIAQAIGVADARMAGLMAGVLAARGARGLVFHGSDGLDELTTTTRSQVWLIGSGEVHEDALDPRQLGLAAASVPDLLGGDPAHNARVVRETLAGRGGPIREIVLLNAAAALLAHAGPRADRPVADQLRPHLESAARSIDSGSAADLLDAWIALTRSITDESGE